MSKLLKSKKWLVFLALVAVACLAGLYGALTASAVTTSEPLSGAIFTTTKDGTIVNGNIYERMGHVYLNGGPQPGAPCTSAGLPDGNYYFQVTDPSGAVLLSLDDITCREFIIDGGLIKNVLGGRCKHRTGTGKCNSKSVKLCPYSPTPNPGGEYKVWVTPVDCYIGPAIDSATGKPISVPGNIFGFIPSQSKTDNFKVRKTGGKPPPGGQPLGIWGYKFYDKNANGIWDFADENGNGLYDAGEPTDEPVISGWPIKITYPDGVTYHITTTGTDGMWSWMVEPGTGPYTISEILPGPGWHQTAPTPPTVTVALVNGDTHVADFGNVCLGAGNALTLGYWQSPNGYADLTANGNSLFNDFVALTPWLWNDDGTPYFPGNAEELGDWLTQGNAKNMACMLSIQWTAMKLNVLSGSVNGDALIYAPGTTSANGAGFATVNAILDEAYDELASHGFTIEGSEYRAYQTALKNALDQANNNYTFVQPTPCPFVYP